MFRVRTSSLIALAILVAVLAALYLLRDRSFQGVPVLSDPAPQFALSAPYRGPVTLGDYQGDAVLLTFGRPSCGTACNPQLPVLRSALDRLGERRRDVRVLYVTLEPDSMNEQGLLAFVQDHDLGFTGLRGSRAATVEAEAAYRALYQAVPDSVVNAAATTVADSGAAPGWQALSEVPPRVYGIDRNGVLRVAWGPADPAAIARDVRTLLRY